MIIIYLYVLIKNFPLCLNDLILALSEEGLCSMLFFPHICEISLFQPIARCDANRHRKIPIFDKKIMSPLQQTRGDMKLFKFSYYFIITFKDAIYLFIISGVNSVNGFGCRSEAPVLIRNTRNIHSCVASEAAKILERNNCCV